MPPWFEDRAGRKVDLNWTRLKREYEVHADAHSPPLRGWGVGAVLDDLGELKGRRVSGRGFDRVEAEIRQPTFVTEDGVEIPGPKRIVEVNSPWSAADMVKQEAAASGILSQYDHPAEHLERPIVWAWVGPDLMWAEGPSLEGFVVGLQRAWLGHKRSDQIDRVTARGSWHAATEAPAFAASWPAWGAFAWARRVYTAGRVFRYAEDQMDAPVDGDASANLLRSVWAEAFSLGAFLAEHRLRLLHSDLLDRGELDLRQKVKGAEMANARLATEYARRRSTVKEIADLLLAAPPANGRRTWSRAALGQEIHDRWKVEPIPALTTIQADLKRLGLP